LKTKGNGRGRARTGAGGAAVIDIVKDSVREAAGIRLRPRICPECGRRYRNFCVACFRKGKLTPAQLLAELREIWKRQAGGA